jgi:hypothetical protein
MKHCLTLAALFVACVVGTGAVAQQAPAGVNYKPASDAVNATARANLEKALAGAPDFPKDLLNGIFTCGPMLWKTLQPAADKVLLGSKEIVLFLQIPAPTKVEARGMITPEQRMNFWSALLKAYPALKTAKVRKANEKEIRYYWATIPFDIAEPFFAIDAGSDVFIAHFGELAPSLFWIDHVDDLSKLKN